MKAKRQCGSCSECCVQLPIDDPQLKKERNVPCVHLGEGCSGCAIYAARPKICSGYKCIWLHGALPEYMRPDKTGLLWSVSENTKGEQILMLTERTAGLIDKNWKMCCEAARRINEFIHRHATARQVYRRFAVRLYGGWSAAHTIALQDGIEVALAREIIADSGLDIDWYEQDGVAKTRIKQADTAAVPAIAT